MSHLNVEIKARCDRLERIRQILARRGARFKGTDHQTDTYFRCRRGRLKLREGRIENALIHYDRKDRAGPKDSTVTLHRLRPDPAIKEALARALGVLAVVEKTREIHFIGNVKFHLDNVSGLGKFVEIEAIGAGAADRDRLRAQCDEYLELFGIRPEDLVACSYSDLILAQSPAQPADEP